MSGRHAGPFASYTESGDVDEVFPPTGGTFATTQTHWFRITDGQVIEHWANRDDLGTAKQLGWVPPTPFYLARMALAKRRARRGRAREDMVGQPTASMGHSSAGWITALGRGCEKR
jgi:SnoaL-like polyketide cyclase